MTTPECNLCCRYCGGSLHGMPDTITYPLSELKKFISNDTHSIIAFYGGEPLIKTDIIKTYLQELNADHFVINTNGYFIEQLDSYIHKFDSILLSIDGRKKITDYYREDGCYDKVINAVKYLKNNNFKGEIIARMSVSHKSDIYEEVTHLLSIFPYVHWQLDMIWSPLWEVDEFKQWVTSSYVPGLKKLVEQWIHHIKQDEILGIIPFLGIMSRILHGGSGLPCQSGTKSVTITTDGTILACPIAPDFTWNKIGDIHQGFHPIEVGSPCTNCEVFDICGGRCLFAHKERLWGKEGFDAMCYVTKFLINELKKHKNTCLPIKEQIRYPPFNNTTEIIP